MFAAVLLLLYAVVGLAVPLYLHRRTRNGLILEPVAGFSIRSVRGYSFGTAAPGRFHVMAVHHYPFDGGQDVPQPQHFFSPGHPIRSVRISVPCPSALEQHRDFVLYYVLRPDLVTPNPGILRAFPDVHWHGELFVYRCGIAPRRVVNMRRDDRQRVEFAVRQFVLHGQ